MDSNFDSNSDTLLFTRLAENEINNDRVEEAIDILKIGIQNFPNYPSSYFLYGKALLTIGNIDEAKNAFTSGINLIGFQDTSDYYLSLIPETVDDTLHKNTNLPTVNKDVTFENVDASSEIESNRADNQNNLIELADQLSNAKMDIPHVENHSTELKKDTEKDSPNSAGRSLVSETLARIYFSQENYNEAKEIYETLIEIQPEREDYYQRKLEEIDLKIGS